MQAESGYNLTFPIWEIRIRKGTMAFSLQLKWAWTDKYANLLVDKIILVDEWKVISTELFLSFVSVHHLPDKDRSLNRYTILLENKYQYFSSVMKIITINILRNHSVQCFWLFGIINYWKLGCFIIMLNRIKRYFY